MLRGTDPARLSEDPEIIERGIRKALTDDALVDRAAQDNWQIAIARLDAQELKAKALGYYG